MKKGAILRVSIVLLVCVSLGSFFVPSTAAQTGFKLTSIVRRHDSSPDGNPFFGCDTCVGEIAGPRAFNDRGDLVIRTALEGYCDLAGFLISGTEKIPLTVGCQQTAWGELQFDEAAINEQSQVVFTVYSYVDNQFNKMVLFSYQNGALTPLAGDGDPTPISTIFSRTSLVGPAINDKGDIIFEGFSIDDHGRERADIFMYSDDERRSIVGSGNPSPKGGQFSFVRLTSSPQVNASGEVLFYSSVVEGPAHQTDGLFQITRDEIKKVVVTGDNLPAGRRVDAPLGSLNDKGEVAFISNANDLFTQQDAGIYLYSGGLIQKVMTVGEAIPGGGHFGSFLKTGYVYPGPRINNNSAIAFKAYVKDRDSHVAIFLASPRAIIKVVAVGDALPTGETIKSIDTFALNNLGQIAFFALDKKGRTLGVFKATPSAPEIKAATLKRKKGSLELRVDGVAMITNDTVIEINGVGLGAMDYPATFQQERGFTTRVRSRDSRLEQLMPEGQP